MCGGVSGGRQDGVWRGVCGGEVSGGCLEVVGGCLEGDWGPGRGLGVVWGVLEGV